MESWSSLGPLRGLNTSENPLSLGPGWATALNNIVLDPQSSLATKRTGSSYITPTLPTNTLNIASLIIDTSNTTLVAFVYTGAAYQFWRSINGAAFVQEASAPNLPVIRAVYFNRKLFFCVDSPSANRMYVYVPGTGVRLCGLSVSVAATVANTGAGAYAATLRYYKVDWVNLTGTVVNARSELSPSVSFTPSGAGTAARVTKPATLEHATHWRVWGSADNVIYKKISGDIAVGTTTYDDSVNPSAYSGVFQEAVGTFLPPPGVCRILASGPRLVLAGTTTTVAPSTGETSPSANRVWYTPVLGSLDQGDDERIPNTGTQKNFIDLSDPPTGDLLELAGPVEGQVYAFSKTQSWRLVPTGDITIPYLTYQISTYLGSNNSNTATTRSADVGETETGAPAVYFTNNLGVFRISSGGDVQLVSHDINPGLLATSTTRGVLSWPSKGRLMVITLLAGTINTAVIYVFHWRLGRVENGVLRGGWTQWTVPDANVATPILTTAMLHRENSETDVIPYLLLTNTTKGYRFNGTTAVDGVTTYAASLTAAPILATGATSYVRVDNPQIVATAVPGESLRVSATRDFGTETRSALVSLAPDGTETRVVRSVEGLFQGDVTALEITIADPLPTSAVWQVDYCTVPTYRQDPR